MISAARAAGVVCLTFALAGCAPLGPDTPLTADQAVRAACRQQAEQSFDTRNRVDRYKSDAGRDSPFSAQVSPQINRGLAERHGYEQDYQDCLRSRGTRQTPAALPAGPKEVLPTPPRASDGLPTPPRASSLSPAAPAASSPPAASSDLARPPALTR